MIRMARIASLIWLILAISSLLGLMARHLPPIGIGMIILFVILLFALLFAFLAGNVLDKYLNWEQDTFLALCLLALIGYPVGGLIGWLVLV
ncbi:MAG: hypothetical protein HC769_25525 [Cyanobacteria bacterium CRU_2_1]|nr:hypothetical protein [Cyanobacteria bacterium CRU_2_1]